MSKPFTTEQVIARLRELERRWPDDLWLFASGDALTLLRTVDGKRVMDGNSVDQEQAIESFDGIGNDGGGW